VTDHSNTVQLRFLCGLFGARAMQKFTAAFALMTTTMHRLHGVAKQLLIVH